MVFLEIILGIPISIISDIIYDMGKERFSAIKQEDDVERIIRSMSISDRQEILRRLEEEDKEEHLHESTLEYIDDHHDEMGILEWNRDELLRLVDSTEWENLVGGFGKYLDNFDMEHWHGEHIEDIEYDEASTEDLLEFHKWAFYWRLRHTCFKD